MTDPTIGSGTAVATDLPVQIDLGGPWTCRAIGGQIPPALVARLTSGFPGWVPGVVHTDLLEAGLVPDPFDGDNEQQLTWIGWVDWEYVRTFEWDGSGLDRHDLVAEGLDTVATIWLNGAEVGRTANHHRSYRFEVGPLLQPGTNEIRVRFTSACRYARDEAERLGPRPHVNTHPYNAIRKPAYSFGWDWGPELVTAGIWRPIRLESWSVARLAEVRALPGYHEEHGARIDLSVMTENRSDGSLMLEVAVYDGAEVLARATEQLAESTAQFLLPVPDASPWWPRGHGGQPLYDIVVTLSDDEGRTLDTWRRRIGFRSVALDTHPDATGRRFAVRVNGIDFYIRGANWIPADSFLPRVTRGRLDRSVADAVDANINLLRVWGGGIYESEDFYELCDQAGLLVWQDFQLACAAYAEDASLAAEIEAEAREAVVRLGVHPSLALWNGGNESVWGYVDWGWRADLGEASWGDGYYVGLFPRLLAELAPGVPYSPNSPFSFDRYVHPNDPANGTMHVWDVWNHKDYASYREHTPRFVSEFGFQGPPALSTLLSSVHDEPVSRDGVQLRNHQKAEDGMAKLARGLGDHLPNPVEFTDWHWATQLNQARAVRFGIEHFRSLAPLNDGVVVWQLNDCWPAVSWAAVDSHAIRKPLWFALRAAYADRLLTVQPRGQELRLFAHNDTGHAWQAPLLVRRLTLDGRELAAGTVPLDVPARHAAGAALERSLVTPGDPTNEFLVVEAPGGERALWYFVEDPQLRLRADSVRVSVEQTPTGYRVGAEATTLTKDLALLVDQLHPAARVDRGLITLLPGETMEFEVTLEATIDPRRLSGRPVLRSANDLVAGREG